MDSKEKVEQMNTAGAERQGGITSEDIIGAVARGWCAIENAAKPMDEKLAFAIVNEVERLLATQAQAAPSAGAGEPAKQKPVARLHAEVSDNPFSDAGTIFDIVILDRDRCFDGMELYAHPAAAVQPDQRDLLIAEARAVFDLMLDGCNDTEFGDFQNGHGETIGPRMDALHAKLRAFPVAAAVEPVAIPAGMKLVYLVWHEIHWIEAALTDYEGAEENERRIVYEPIKEEK